MAARKGKCIQFGGCSKADSKEVMEVAAGDEFSCKECGKPLQEIDQGGAGGSRKRTPLLVLAALVVFAGAVMWAFWPRGQYSEEPPLTEKKADLTSKDTAAANGGQSASVQTYPCGLKPIDQPDVTRLLTYLKQGMTYASQSRYELALKEFEQVRQIDPNFLAMHANIAAAQLKLKRLAEAELSLQEEIKLIGCLDQTKDADLPQFAYMLEAGKTGAGDADAARAQTMRERLKQARGVAHYNLACVRAVQGATDQALAELHLAVDGGFSDTAALTGDPDLAKVRSAPGFQDVLVAVSSKAPANPK